ncbi:MAG: hypothetical protein HOP10_09380 [Chitinophagaceae bacterium]|nr:hypothetical protein [Chitinophagaceae bacterium]
MNQLLPYELELNQQWPDLPLPDVNMAWADMKRRLDEEDKRRVVPFWLTGCAGWGLLGILLLGLGWWIVRPEKWFTHKQGTEKTNGLPEENRRTEKDTLYHQADTATTSANTTRDTILINNDTSSLAITTKDPLANKKTKPVAAGDETVSMEKIRGNTTKRKKPVVEQKKDEIIGKKKEGNNEKQLPVEKKNETGIKIPPGDKAKQKELPADTATMVKRVEKPKRDTVASIVKTEPVADTVQKKDSVVKKIEEPVVNDKKPKKDSSKKSPLVFSAGIGLYQQLPVAGQKWTPYSSSGRKTSLADYIPSVYVRITKPGKWFLQSEFRYGAPQQTKEFKFRQLVTTDTNTQGVQFTNTNAYTLKKTFYHQLPLSFNYYILPNWSVGAGMQWNNFHAAVAEREFIRRTSFTQQTIDSTKFIEPLKKDSAYEFKRSYWQAILQTQYQWRRFTFGARYNFGLQPYISFTLPGGNPQEEKNSSLQLFILFELWKSKKKDKN